jgi:hypothetical protein
MAKSKPSLEEQIFDEVAALAAQYHEIPEGAKTFEGLLAEFPQIPKSPLNKWLAKKVKSGEWLKGRRANATYYWPAK